MAPSSPAMPAWPLSLICLDRRRCEVILAMLRNQQPYLTPQQGKTQDEEARHAARTA